MSPDVVDLLYKHADFSKHVTSRGVCSLCGREDDGFRRKEVLSGNFRDYERLKFSSDCICYKCAALFATNSFFNSSIRNFNILATPTEIRKLKYADIADIIKTPPAQPYVLLVTFSRQKYHFFDAQVNTPPATIITVGTDKGKLMVDRGKFNHYAAIITELFFDSLISYCLYREYFATRSDVKTSTGEEVQEQSVLYDVLEYDKEVGVFKASAMILSDYAAATWK